MSDLRSAFSSFLPMLSFPRGLMILCAGTILQEPIDCANEAKAHRWTVGRPNLSSSQISVAPQRVLVPHVDVKMAPDTPASFNSSAIALPIFFEWAELVATPTVE